MRVLGFVAGCILAGLVAFGALMYLDSNFNESVRDWAGGLRASLKGALTQVDTAGARDQAAAAIQVARPLAHSCEVLARERRNDPETLLGIAFIYRHFPTRLCSYEGAVDRVLAADPNNPTARAMKIELDAGMWLAQVKNRIAKLERLLSEKQRLGAGSVMMACDDEPYYSMIEATDTFVQIDRSAWANTTDKPRYVITDTEAAKHALMVRMWNDLPELLARIDRASENDPDNAFYDYVKARLFFEKQEPDRAIENVRAGLARKMLRDHVAEARMAAMKVLKLQKYPRVCRDYLAEAGMSPGEYVRTFVCKVYLDQMARAKKSQGQESAAKELADLSAGIMEQCSRVQIQETQPRRSE
jgi:hypothetical protein